MGTLLYWWFCNFGLTKVKSQAHDQAKYDKKAEAFTTTPCRVLSSYGCLFKVCCILRALFYKE